VENSPLTRSRLYGWQPKTGVAKSKTKLQSCSYSVHIEPESKSFLPQGLGKCSAHSTSTSMSQSVEPVLNASSSRSSWISSAELALRPIDAFQYGRNSDASNGRHAGGAF